MQATSTVAATACELSIYKDTLLSMICRLIVRFGKAQVSHILNLFISFMHAIPGRNKLILVKVILLHLILLLLYLLV